MKFIYNDKFNHGVEQSLIYFVVSLFRYVTDIMKAKHSFCFNSVNDAGFFWD